MGSWETKFKLISGFPSRTDVFLAMERNEVDGICESLDSVIASGRTGSTQKGQRAVSWRRATQPDPQGIPFIPDLARNAEEKQNDRVPLRRGRASAGPSWRLRTSGRPAQDAA